MPLIIPKTLPAYDALYEENVFVMHRERAASQHIRPLEILILNLMPTKIATETQIARLLANIQTVACHQQLDRFANGAAPHVQAGSQLKLVGQLLACIDVLVNDDLIDLIRHLLCKGGSAVVLNVAEYAMILCHRICTPFCSACLQLL